MSGGIRDGYADHPGGAAGWYAEHGATYRNPHEAGVRAALLALGPWVGTRVAGSGRVLDLACGSGEATMALVDAGVPLDRIDAADPFTVEAYRARTGRSAWPWSFEALAVGAAPGDGEPSGPWALVVCSFALHLCAPSWLAPLCHRLAAVADALVVLTPHKRPELRPAWGFLLDGETYDPRTRVRCRTYVSAQR